MSHVILFTIKNNYSCIWCRAMSDNGRLSFDKATSVSKITNMLIGFCCQAVCGGINEVLTGAIITANMAGVM